MILICLAYSRYMLCEFKKYLCPLYIVFSTAQKKKASHHHPLGGTSFLLWYIDSTLSCKGKKVLRRAMSNDIVHHHDVLIFLLLPSIQQLWSKRRDAGMFQTILLWTSPYSLAPDILEKSLTKGQLISKCPSGVTKSTKKPTKFF